MDVNSLMPKGATYSGLLVFLSINCPSFYENALFCSSEEEIESIKRCGFVHKEGLYAIFDGHSGREAAEYLQSHLFDNILSEPDYQANPKRAIKRARCKVTDNEILDGVVAEFIILGSDGLRKVRKIKGLLCLTSANCYLGGCISE
ncbi:unnamed protein product [Dovyalis caffra]|uniref:PPM-type phosphatase domain-containing protein n=1 Tax=Dovyalis caffra TaxID=77055 RepID=A0AAV1S4U5_9ROSI|nr:unnamed protein product [Dovyalis caffra]